MKQKLAEQVIAKYGHISYCLGAQAEHLMIEDWIESLIPWDRQKVFAFKVNGGIVYFLRADARKFLSGKDNLKMNFWRD